VPSSPTSSSRIVAVAVPVPGLALLSYRVPMSLAMPMKGVRVEVPVGSRTLIGCVVEPDAPAPDGAALRDVITVLDDEPFLPPSIVDLALWMGEYYASGPGDALAIAMPPSARRADGGGFRTTTVATLVAPAPDGQVRGARQSQALALLADRPEGLALTALARQRIGGATVKALERSGHVFLRHAVVERDPFAGELDGPWTLAAAPGIDHTLSEEQAEALDSLRRAADRQAFETTVLQGVTGSGKTEIYLRLAAHVIARGRRALVLVPEIALTPALVGLFRARFGGRVAIQHSGLSAGERHDQWHRVRRGEVDVTVGTRSAVFAPLDRLGLIIVDEEHEPSYKQEETPRYHGRDVAVMRGSMEQTLVVLGSATPSLESAANAASGRYTLVRLRRRVRNRPLARVRIVDMRQELAAEGTPVIFSRTLLESIAARLERREQSLILLNRRGFATVIFCRQCGASMECPHCSVNLTFHRAARRVRCHYCNFATAVPKYCGECGGEFLEQTGAGTERLEVELRERFPDARVARVDRDTIRRRGAISRILAAVGRREVDIVVGTQMIAKGHDFPAVTLVGVVSADVGLGLADFRAGERTFQLLTQVVGRSGRGDTEGEAVIQTLYPDHYSVQAAARQDYEAFFERESEFRRAMRYPPAVAMINVVVKARGIEQAMTDALDLASRIRAKSAGQVLGPAPAALSKIKDEYRAQFFVKGSRRKAMRLAVQEALAARPDLRRRTIVDVDPVSVI